MEKDLVIDASDQVLGRLSSRIAKNLMKGESVTVVNAEKAIITGEPEIIVENFRIKKRRGDPHHGPFYPKTPESILRRSVRGMMPYKKPSGRGAFSKLKVYPGNPKNLKGEKIAKTSEHVDCKFISLGEISKKMRGM